jgi:hypothetical protein
MYKWAIAVRLFTNAARLSSFTRNTLKSTLVPLLGGNDMATKLNRSAFRELIEQDIAWLLAQPRTLERDHIEHILENAERAYYDTTESSKEEANDCRCDPNDDPEWMHECLGSAS